MGAFGDKLRQRREQRGISLDAISGTTKISTRMLRAIEDEHFDQLPGGVFNKGFVKAYARQVGIDEEEAVSDYLLALRESQIQAQAILPNFRASGERAVNEVPPIQPPAIQLVKAAPEARNFARTEPAAKPRSADRSQKDLREAVRRGEIRKEEIRKEEIHIQEAPAEVSARPVSFLNLSVEPEENESQAEVPLPQPVSTNSSHRFSWERLAAALLAITLIFAFWAFRRRSHTTDATQVAANQQFSLPVSTPQTNITDTPTPAPKPVPIATTNAVTPSPVPPSPNIKPSATTPIAHTAKPKPPSKFTLQIRASKTSWISVMADGQPVAKETLIAPANTSIRAEHEIVVRTGNAAAINFFLNGKDIPAAGNEGEVRVYTFDASGLQSSALAQPTNPTN
jgi:hypothetical protein